jgi:hypothetical protein
MKTKRKETKKQELKIFKNVIDQMRKPNLNINGILKVKKMSVKELLNTPIDES